MRRGEVRSSADFCKKKLYPPRGMVIDLLKGKQCLFFFLVFAVFGSKTGVIVLHQIGKNPIEARRRSLTYTQQCRTSIGRNAPSSLFLPIGFGIAL